MHKTALFAAMFLAGQAFFAAAADRPSPIIMLSACSADIMTNMQIAKWVREAGLPGHVDTSSQVLDAKRRLSQCAEKALPAALDAAGDHADLRIAIKEYYVKQSAFFAAIGTNTEGFARDQEMEAFKRVDMEMKLAGIR